MQPLFVAKRPFDPSAGEAWDRYVAWSGLTQLREIVTLDTMLCPTVPEELVPSDWEHNVHADYQVFFFRSLDYLLRRVKGNGRLNILLVLKNPTASEVAGIDSSGFDFAGFDLVDVRGCECPDELRRLRGSLRECGALGARTAHGSEPRAGGPGGATGPAS